MAYFKLALTPGIDKQNTEYGAEGGWIDGDNIRFRYGLPEKIGGWEEFTTAAQYLVGMSSNIFTWNSLAAVPFAITGTDRKLYVFTGGAWYDITPIRLTTGVGDVTFAASTGSAIITVTDTSHGAILGDFVTFSGAVTLGSAITAAILNSEYEITSIINANSYTITAPVNATAGDSGNGGGSVVGAYQINIGSDVSYFDFGWGTGSWGTGTWGTPRAPGSGLSLVSRVWQFDNYGEDVVCQIANGAVYYWELSLGTSARAIVLSGAPTKNTYALLSTPDRHLVCFGTETTIGDPTTQDPMFVRFSNQEDITSFVESATNTAGGQRLSDGSRIVTAIRSRGQILIFTDISLHGMQYIGPPYTFGFQQLSANSGCIGPHAALDVNGVAFWMGTDAFYVFDGTVKKLACTVQDYVFKDMNLVQGFKNFIGLNSQFNEVTWWYCSFTSDYIDRCVTFNYLENVWSIGTMARTAWINASAFEKPLGTQYLETSTAGTISTIYGLTAGRTTVYNQETGTDADGVALAANIKSGYFDIGDGDDMLYMKRFIPDFKNQVGDLTVHLLLRAFPQATASPSSLDPYVITPSTEKVDTRARGRQISLRIESTALETTWRFGTMRVDLQPDGLR
tara:strand:- start:226 stop:2091 length:1866 start_codon:yes stop_codon:yes gene_type:complete